MPSPQIERKLAAIMFTDIAGYTESMSKSESKSLDTLEKKRSILKPLLKEYKGTFVKEIGDGTLSYFESAVNAATCAVKLQETTYDDKEMNIRVGIHIGDIVFKDGDVFGGGVNVASRLESIAPAGGVCVSKSVYDELSNQDDFDGIELGLQSLKGVGRLVEVFGLKGEKLNEPKPSEYQDNKVAIHTDDEVPSVAIIPFRNKGKEEDTFYAYGICADLISDCSSAGLIRVASLEQIEELGDLTLKEKVKQLDVRYTATGTLWKMDKIFQLSIELYDTKESKVIWSDRWEESWDNLTSIKGNISDGLLKALDMKSKFEKKIESINTEAYEFYLKGMYKSYKCENREEMAIVRGLFKKSIDLDNNLFEAKGMLGWTNIQTGDYDNAMKIFNSAYIQVEKLEHKRGMGYFLGFIGFTFYLKGDSDKAFECYTQSIEIKEEIGEKRGLGLTFTSMGHIYMDKGDYEKALDYYERSIIIFNEIDDKYGLYYGIFSIGTAKRRTGSYDKALEYYKRSIKIAKELSNQFEIGMCLNSFGTISHDKGDYDKALDYYNSSLKIQKEFGHKRGMGNSLNNIGLVCQDTGDYKQAEEYLEQSLDIKRNISLGVRDLLETITSLYLSQKKLNKEFDEKEIHRLIKKTEYIETTINYYLYQLLEDTSYLETAYNQVQEKADNLEPDVAAKFLSYPIPKAIVEEWEKLNP